MSDIYSKFDAQFDTAALAADAAEVEKNNGGDYPEIPDGKYEVKMTQAELAETKSGLPAVKARFQILTGQYKNSYLFYTQVIHKGFGIFKCSEFFGSMDMGIDLTFVSYSDYAQKILDVAEAAEGFSFGIEYGHDKNNYSTFKITDIFEG